MKKISKDTPLFELTIRKYENPESLDNRELVRKLCLSLGLLQPGDSRDIIVDIFYVLLKAKKQLTSKEIEEKTIAFRNKNNLELKGIASSNIRRQLLRLRDMFFVQKQDNTYKIGNEFKELKTLSSLFAQNIEKFYLKSIIERVKDYLKEADKRFELEN